MPPSGGLHSARLPRAARTGPMCSAHATCRRRAVAADALLTFSARAMTSRAGVAAVLVKMEVLGSLRDHVLPAAVHRVLAAPVSPQLAMPAPTFCVEHHPASVADVLDAGTERVRCSVGQ